MAKTPVKYSPDICKKICDRIATGESLRAICEDKDMPSTRGFQKWLYEYEDLVRQYTRAREDQADYFADDVVTIADDEPDPQRARVRIDARKWFAGQVKPKVWGAKVQNEHTDGEGNPLALTVNFVGNGKAD